MPRATGRLCRRVLGLASNGAYRLIPARDAGGESKDVSIRRQSPVFRRIVRVVTAFDTGGSRIPNFQDFPRRPRQTCTIRLATDKEGQDMVALIFLAVIAAVFVAVVALEGGDPSLERRPKGLLTLDRERQLAGENRRRAHRRRRRRAAALCGDQLRRASRAFKLALGIAAAAVLGFGFFLTAANPQRRVDLARARRRGIRCRLSHGVQRVCAVWISADDAGPGPAGADGVGAGVFAVSRSALSLAVLSMVGAFMAPAFAVDDPGPRVVYGYYVAISLLTLAMVSFRGWRPLIHLSFLFTLAGSAFFAWTADYFVPGNSAVMFPLLAMLVAVHVAMPIAERRWARGMVVESLDTVYLLALPVVAALTALAHSAVARRRSRRSCGGMRRIWLAAAAWLYSQRREGMASHAIIGLLMLGFGLAARFRDLPWELVGLGIAVAALALSARRSQSARLQGFLAGLVLVLAAVHMISALAPADRQHAVPQRAIRRAPHRRRV